MSSSDSIQGATRQDGPLIREMRIERELTRTALAERAGCHPKALQHVEQETRNASELMLQRIARALGCKRQELMRDVTRRAA